jgi:uncharacterized protein
MEAPLHHAARVGDVDQMAALLTAGSGVDDTNARGKTPLMYAAEIGLAEPVMLLLDARAAVNRVANDA